MGMDDQEISALVAQAQRDPAAFGALYDHYVKAVYRYHANRVGDAEDAQDLTAQTFLAALEALPRYRHRGSFAAWLFQIARSKAVDFFRRRRAQASIEQTGARAPQEPLAHIAEIDQLRTLLRALGDDERELLNLRYVAELKLSEIAAVFGKSEDAVKKSLYRLLARLQQQLEAHDERQASD